MADPLRSGVKINMKEKAINSFRFKPTGIKMFCLQKRHLWASVMVKPCLQLQETCELLKHLQCFAFMRIYFMFSRIFACLEAWAGSKYSLLIMNIAVVVTVSLSASRLQISAVIIKNTTPLGVSHQKQNAAALKVDERRMNHAHLQHHWSRAEEGQKVPLKAPWWHFILPRKETTGRKFQHVVAFTFFV